jgi:hypothetical protein
MWTCSIAFTLHMAFLRQVCKFCMNANRRWLNVWHVGCAQCTHCRIARVGDTCEWMLSSSIANPPNLCSLCAVRQRGWYQSHSFVSKHHVERHMCYYHLFCWVIAGGLVAGGFIESWGDMFPSETELQPGLWIALTRSYSRPTMIMLIRISPIVVSSSLLCCMKPSKG